MLRQYTDYALMHILSKFIGFRCLYLQTSTVNFIFMT